MKDVYLFIYIFFLVADMRKLTHTHTYTTRRRICQNFVKNLFLITYLRMYVCCFIKFSSIFYYHV